MTRALRCIGCGSIDFANCVPCDVEVKVTKSLLNELECSCGILQKVGECVVIVGETRAMVSAKSVNSWEVLMPVSWQWLWRTPGPVRMAAPGRFHRISKQIARVIHG